MCSVVVDVVVDNVDDGCGWMGRCKRKEESGHK